jgi:2-amino-4-hydroxy-6-hydroxymethyldihydropteridine diphosphokinase
MSKPMTVPRQEAKNILKKLLITVKLYAAKIKDIWCCFQLVMHIAYLLTGSNLGERAHNLYTARRLINEQCGELKGQSCLYETEPWGLQEQNYFLNQALKLHTTITPQQLLKKILNIEKQMGRIRQEKYGPRIIDIDILFYDNIILHEQGLSIPHPQLQNRRFALQCMYDITPGLVHPVSGNTIQHLLRSCSDTLAVKIWE